MHVAHALSAAQAVPSLQQLVLMQVLQVASVVSKPQAGAPPAPLLPQAVAHDVDMHDSKAVYAESPVHDEPDVEPAAQLAHVLSFAQAAPSVQQLVSRQVLQVASVLEKPHVLLHCDAQLLDTHDSKAVKAESVQLLLPDCAQLTQVESAWQA